MMTSAARLISCYVCLVFSLTAAPQSARAGEDQAVDSSSQAEPEHKSEFRTELIRGKVVWLAEVLKSEFGISTVPEVAESSLAIFTDDRQLLPIVEDLRGRAFRNDERLRGKQMELLARRYKQQPLIQILRVYQIDSGKKYEVDYWCDVCAIVMYETGPCACCQDHNRLRKRLVINGEAGPEIDLDQPTPSPGEQGE
jgi:hypothetical protein